MQQNPLFPSSNDSSQIPDYLRTSSIPSVPTPEPVAQPQASWVQPTNPLVDQPPQAVAEHNPAADMIRQKLAAIYANEPSAQAELTEVKTVQAPLSKHQQFMQNLQQSGRSMADVQTAWHEYYANLPDQGKYEIWQEFYAASNPTPTSFGQPLAEQSSLPAATEPSPTMPVAAAPAPQPFQQPLQTPTERNWVAPPAAEPIQWGSGANESAYQPLSPTSETTPQAPPAGSSKTPDMPLPGVADIKQKILNSVNSAKKSKNGSYLHSLGFGLACGIIVMVIFMFSFFNEAIISPFIQPSRTGVDTPFITDPTNSVAAVSKEPEVIIPKINVQIPVDYSQTTTSEAAIETALESGVVHYPTTVMPGQTGNAAFFGHSSNNIFNPGKYKFAFVLLHKLTEGDTFYLTYQGKTYAYEVISHQIVEPTAVSVLGPVAGQTATATLITCDPPGTSLHRLVVVGKQISPDPNSNSAPPSAPTTPTITASETNLPGNGPTLLSRLWHAVF